MNQESQTPRQQASKPKGPKTPKEVKPTANPAGRPATDDDPST